MSEIPALQVPVPVITRERFAQLTGLEEGVIRGMIDKGYLPTVKIGRYRLINLTQLTRECELWRFSPYEPSQHP